MSLYEEFLAGTVPENLSQLAGEWIVRGILGPLPPIRFLMQKKIFRAEGEGKLVGNNQFLGFLNVAPFFVERGPSELEPALEVVRICYDVPGNLGLVRRLTDEVRQVGEEKFLGRGIYRFPQGPKNTFWFSVGKE